MPKTHAKNTIYKHFLKIDIVGEHLRCAGISFHALTARMKNERLASSVRARGTSSCPSSVALVARADTLARLVIRARSSSGPLSSWVSLYMVCRSRSVTMSSMLRQPSSRSVPDTCSRYPRPVTMRAPKFMHFCSLRFWVTVHPPHAHIQYCKWGNTSASTKSRLVSHGTRRCILASPIKMQ